MTRHFEVFNVSVVETNMFSKIIPKIYTNSVVRRNLITPSSLNSVKSTIPLRKFLRWTVFGATIGGLSYDAYNDFEVGGGLTRFLRSLKIAALISIDYSWNLYGLRDGSDIYEQVPR